MFKRGGRIGGGLFNNWFVVERRERREISCDWRGEGWTIWEGWGGGGAGGGGTLRERDRHVLEMKVIKGETGETKEEESIKWRGVDGEGERGGVGWWEYWHGADVRGEWASG